MHLKTSELSELDLVYRRCFKLWRWLQRMLWPWRLEGWMCQEAERYWRSGSSLVRLKAIIPLSAIIRCSASSMVEKRGNARERSEVVWSHPLKTIVALLTHSFIVALSLALARLQRIILSSGERSCTYRPWNKSFSGRRCMVDPCHPYCCLFTAAEGGRNCSTACCN